MIVKCKTIYNPFHSANNNWGNVSKEVVSEEGLTVDKEYEVLRISHGITEDVYVIKNDLGELKGYGSSLFIKIS